VGKIGKQLRSRSLSGVSADDLDVNSGRDETSKFALYEQTADWAGTATRLLCTAQGCVRSARATAVRSADYVSLSNANLVHIPFWYRGTKGIADNQAKHTQIAKDGLRLAARRGAGEAAADSQAHVQDVLWRAAGVGPVAGLAGVTHVAMEATGT
jgi:hypothetical protein